MSDEELIHEYAAKVSRGEITFDKVRPQLELQGIEEARIKQIVRKVDDEVQAALVTQSKASSIASIIRLGVILVVIGCLVALGVLAGFISKGNSYIAAVAYGSIAGGSVVIVFGIRRKRNMGSGSETGRKFTVRKSGETDIRE